MSDSAYVCPLCHVKVKTKLQRAHVNGREHRERVKQQQTVTAKRPAVVEPIQEVSAKKARITTNVEPITADSVAVRQPEVVNEELPDGLPSNFFDSKAKENEAAAQAAMDKEVSKFLNEVEQMEKKEDEVDDREDAVRKDLEMIDEQIEMWRNFNELEKKRDELIANVHSEVRMETEPIIEPESNDAANDSDDDEFDIFSVDWRARRI